jgi:hypothetical protein
VGRRSHTYTFSACIAERPNNTALQRFILTTFQNSTKEKDLIKAMVRTME